MQYQDAVCQKGRGWSGTASLFDRSPTAQLALLHFVSVTLTLLAAINLNRQRCTNMTVMDADSM